MKTAIYIVICCIISYVTGSLVALSDTGREIGQHRAETNKCNELISVQERYIAMLESRLADKYNRAVTLTAYTARSRECDASSHVTAMMVKPRPGRTIAVSRDLFNDGWTFGRSVYIAGLGMFVVEDLMHSKHKEQIDILMGSVHEARQFGKIAGKAVLIADGRM